MENSTPDKINRIQMQEGDSRIIRYVLTISAKASAIAKCGEGAKDRNWDQLFSLKKSWAEIDGIPAGRNT